MSVGITVLPPRSIRAAPAGAVTRPLPPTLVTIPFSTRKADPTIGPLPSPGISRAFSNRTDDARPVCVRTVVAAASRMPTDAQPTRARRTGSTCQLAPDDLRAGRQRRQLRECQVARQV